MNWSLRSIFSIVVLEKTFIPLFSICSVSFFLISKSKPLKTKSDLKTKFVSTPKPLKIPANSTAI